MRLRVFGTSADDKGSQLEVLTGRLLAKLGYRDIVLNAVGAGGSEVDVRATFPLPSVHGGSHLQTIVECKAHDAQINLPDWLKFLGKMYYERARRRSQVRGVLIALSGANGNVLGAFDELRTFDETTELITGERLAQLVTGEFSLPAVEHASTHLSQLTKDPITEISLGYYAGQLFWIAEFANSSYTILRGPALGDGPQDALNTTVRAHFGALRYRDLRQEEEGRQRVKMAKKYVLGEALRSERHSTTLDSLSPEASLGITPSDVTQAISALSEDGLLRKTTERIEITEISQNIKMRIVVIETLIDEQMFLSLFGTPEWFELIDEALLVEILRIQANIELPSEAWQDCIQLLKWSPTALLWALRGDPMLVVHRQQGVPEPKLTNSDDVRYFRLQLLRFAVTDFQNQALAPAYFERFGLRELEFSRRAAFKSMERSELVLEISERLGIGRLAAELGGGVMRVWLTEDAPEPWLWPSATVRTNIPEPV